MTHPASMRPVWVGPCFGWLHRGAAEGGGVAVLICPGLTRDRLDAHHSLRLLADALARAGYPTLRFDYPGTGDSAEVAPCGQVWQYWQASVQAALDWLRVTTGATRLLVCGLRLGATLAGLVAGTREDVAGLALLAPVLRGRSYVQQLQMEARLQGHAAVSPGSGLELHEVLLDAKDVEQVVQADLRQLRLAPGVQVGLFLQTPSKLGAECAAAWRSQGALVLSADFAGLEPLLRHNEETEGTPPDFTGLLHWVRAAVPPQPAEQAPPVTWSTEKQGSGWVETPHFFGSDEALFGMLCRPDRTGGGPHGDRAVIIGNSGRDPHYGLARFGVELARHLAGLGIASLRMDFAGLGDSIGPPGKRDALTAVFESDRRADIRAAADLLMRLGYQRLAAQGLCSGAYHVLQGALIEPRIDTLLLVNLPAFEWRDGDTFDFVYRRTTSPRHYLKGLVRRENWRRLLRRELSLRAVAHAQLARIWDRLRRRLLRHAEERGWIAHQTAAGRSMSALAARGVRTLFLFATTDNGIDVMEQEFGTAAASLRQFPDTAYHVEPGFDHLLSTGPMRQTAIGLLSDFLTGPPTTAPPSPAPRQQGLPDHRGRSRCAASRNPHQGLKSATMTIHATIIDHMKRIARQQHKTLVPLADDVPLLESGLDSLCLAVLVANLDDELGLDPFADEEGASIPATVGDFVRVYEQAAARG